MGRDNPHEWFTAGEVADLARRDAIDEVPSTKSGMIKWIKREARVDPNLVDYMSRKRPGQKGGGGTEYHWPLFCEAGPRISTALDTEAQRRECGPNLEEDGWFTADDIAHLAWSARLASVPDRGGRLNGWIADLARRRPKTFGADLDRLTRKRHLGIKREYHYTLFAFMPDLMAVLTEELRLRSDPATRQAVIDDWAERILKADKILEQYSKSRYR